MLPLLLHGERVLHMAPHLGGEARIGRQSAYLASNGALKFPPLGGADNDTSVRYLDFFYVPIEHSYMPGVDALWIPR